MKTIEMTRSVLFFKQKTAYEMRISDWSSDVCSSDLAHRHRQDALRLQRAVGAIDDEHGRPAVGCGARAIPIGDLKPGVVILAAEDRRKDDRAGPRPPTFVASDDLAAAVFIGWIRRAAWRERGCT